MACILRSFRGSDSIQRCDRADAVDIPRGRTFVYMASATRLMAVPGLEYLRSE